MNLRQVNCALHRSAPARHASNLATPGPRPDPWFADQFRRQGLDSLLEQLSVAGESVIDPREFLAADACAPLPTIVQAARELFHKRELPMINRNTDS